MPPRVFNFDQKLSGNVAQIILYYHVTKQFKSHWSHLNFRFRTCFEQSVPWHSGNYTMCIHFEMHTWHDKNIQSNAPYRQVLTTQLNQLTSLAKWSSVRLWTKWLWVWFQLKSLKFLACLNWLGTCFWFQNMCCTINCNIMYQNTFFPYTLRLVRCFQFHGMILMTEGVSKIIALKTWR